MIFFVKTQLRKSTNWKISGGFPLTGSRVEGCLETNDCYLDTDLELLKAVLQSVPGMIYAVNICYTKKWFQCYENMHVDIFMYINRYSWGFLKVVATLKTSGTPFTNMVQL